MLFLSGKGKFIFLCLQSRNSCALPRRNYLPTPGPSCYTVTKKTALPAAAAQRESGLTTYCATDGGGPHGDSTDKEAWKVTASEQKRLKTAKNHQKSLSKFFGTNRSGVKVPLLGPRKKKPMTSWAFSLFTSVQNLIISISMICGIIPISGILRRTSRPEIAPQAVFTDEAETARCVDKL